VNLILPLQVSDILSLFLLFFDGSLDVWNKESPIMSCCSLSMVSTTRNQWRHADLPCGQGMNFFFSNTQENYKGETFISSYFDDATGANELH
jgi:hypothetical protein